MSSGDDDVCVKGVSVWAGVGWYFPGWGHRNQMAACVGELRVDLGYLSSQACWMLLYEEEWRWHYRPWRELPTFWIRLSQRFCYVLRVFIRLTEL